MDKCFLILIVIVILILVLFWQSYRPRRTISGDNVKGALADLRDEISSMQGERRAAATDHYATNFTVIDPANWSLKPVWSSGGVTCPRGYYGDKCQYKMCPGGTRDGGVYNLDSARQWCTSNGYAGSCNYNDGVCEAQ